MRKFIIALVLVISWLFALNNNSNVLADWWQRPDVIPTQPSFGRDLSPSTVEVRPTLSSPSPTSSPNAQPTATPAIGGNPTGTPSSGGGSGSKSDPCANGQGGIDGHPCGWTPDVNNNGGGGGGGGSSSSQPRVGGPQVLGLSDTSSGDLALSDIMILAGILCLAVYARSKINLDQSH